MNWRKVRVYVITTQKREIASIPEVLFSLASVMTHQLCLGSFQKHDIHRVRSYVSLVFCFSFLITFLRCDSVTMCTNSLCFVVIAAAVV